MQVSLVDVATALGLLRVELGQLTNQRHHPNSHPAAPQPSRVVAGEENRKADNNGRNKQPKQQTNAIHRNQVKRVHLQLDIVLNILVAVCCVLVDDPEEDHDAEGKALHGGGGEGLITTVDGGSCWDGRPRNGETQEVLRVHSQRLGEWSLAVRVEKSGREHGQKVLQPARTSILVNSLSWTRGTRITYTSCPFSMAAITTNDEAISEVIQTMISGVVTMPFANGRFLVRATRASM